MQLHEFVVDFTLNRSGNCFERRHERIKVVLDLLDGVAFYDLFQTGSREQVFHKIADRLRERVQ